MARRDRHRRNLANQEIQEMTMDPLYQILTYIFSGTTFVGMIGSVAYYRQTRRAKEAEALQKEADAELRKVEVEKARIDARKTEVDMLHEELEREYANCEKKDQRIEELNKRWDEERERSRVLSDRANAAEQTVNRVSRELVEAKDEIIKLTEEKNHYYRWHCRRPDCMDPRGPEPPREELEGNTSTLTNN